MSSLCLPHLGLRRLAALLRQMIHGGVSVPILSTATDEQQIRYLAELRNQQIHYEAVCRLSICLEQLAPLRGDFYARQAVYLACNHIESMLQTVEGYITE